MAGEPQAPSGLSPGVLTTWEGPTEAAPVASAGPVAALGFLLGSPPERRASGGLERT